MSNASTDIQDWNRIADTYSQMIGVPEDTIYQNFQETLWDSLGELRGRDVLDLGCGHGWLSKLMVGAGAKVTGVDGSSQLLAKARQDYPEIEFLEADLSQGIPDLQQKFDRIVAYMVLMDIPELHALLHSVREDLREGGKFIFTLTHPCFFNYKSRLDEQTGQMYCGVPDYLPPAEWRIENFGGHRHYHRSLTYYFESLRACRLAVTRLYEPPQTPQAAENREFHRNIPKFILIESIPI